MRTVNQAERDAADVLATTWNDAFGSTPVPVDPVKIAYTFGIDVVGARLNDNVSGTLVKLPRQKPAIHINVYDKPVRQRFTCAHELGHYYLHHLTGDQSFGYIDERGHLAGLGTSPKERYANRFAAALLMPLRLLEEWWTDIDVREMAQIFDVSQVAMENRVNSVRDLIES